MRLPCYIFFILLCLMPFVSGAKSFSNVIVFGDSLSDIGNNDSVFIPARGAEFARGTPITNVDPITQRPTIWPQYLMRAHLFDQASLLASRQWSHQKLMEANISYAYASAETGSGYLNDMVAPASYVYNCKTAGQLNASENCVPNLQQQVQTYLSNLQTNQEKPGQNTLFIVWAGGNDFFNNVARFLYRLGNAPKNITLLFPRSALGFSWFPTEKIYRAVHTLIRAGVPPEHIYVVTLPDLSQTPAAQGLVNDALIGHPHLIHMVLQFISTLTHLFNFDLQLWLHYGISGKIKPHVIVINPYFEQLRSGKKIGYFQFRYVNQSCLMAKATPDCNHYLFFDSRHPTTETGQVLAKYIGQVVIKSESVG